MGGERGPLSDGASRPGLARYDGASSVLNKVGGGNEVDKLTLVVPQWQGGGQDLRTYYGALALRDNYLGNSACTTVDITTNEISPTEHDVQGHSDILADMDQVNAVLEKNRPEKVFTLGGGCDADTPVAAYLNQKTHGDMAVVYIDAHGDLNTPEESTSKLYYGMSLRALTGTSAPAIVGRLASTVRPDQLVMGANRSLDPEELRFKQAEHIADFSVEAIEEDPACLARAVAAKGFGHAYVHVDLDALDPDEFPLTPVPEPGGLRRATLVRAVREIVESCDVVGLAILEYCGTAADRGDGLLEELVDMGLSL